MFQISNSFFQSEEEKMIFQTLAQKQSEQDIRIMDKLLQCVFRKEYKVYGSKKEFKKEINDIKYGTISLPKDMKNKVERYISQHMAHLPDGKYIILNRLYDQLDDLINEFEDSQYKGSTYHCPLCEWDDFNDSCPACRMTLY